MGSGLLAKIPILMQKEFGDARVFIITDETVGEKYGRKLLREFHRSGRECALIDFPPSEKSKRQSVVDALYGHLLELGIHRNSLIIGLGGGVVGDVAGFVAATILRGVRFVQVPTTLLAQVDSSIGGKVGIDHARGKNLIGAFYQPSHIYVDPSVIATLPETEFRCGLAEVVKVASTLSSPFFRTLERKAPGLQKSDVSALLPIVKQAAGLKAAVVQKDEYETGLRKVLNFGHTIGHAIETASHYGINHGHAVAIGMMMETRIGETLGITEQGTAQRLQRLLKTLRIPLKIPQIEKKKFLSALSVDKKGDAAGPRFVIPKKIGESAIGVRVPNDLIENILRNNGEVH